MLARLQTVPPDPILHIAEEFAADPAARKLDLGMGVYRDETGATPVMRAVQQAEGDLLAQQKTKTYLPPAGRQEYNEAIGDIVLGEGHAARARGAVRVLQAPGGCGALRLALELVKLAGAEHVFVGVPTWANHQPVIAACGLEPRTFPYFDVRTGRVLFEQMMAALERIPARSALLVQGCGHNPTGASLTRQQEEDFIGSVAARGHLPIIDLAYHGLCDGLNEDVRSTRRLVEAVPEALIAVSCSKNFAMYRERVGALVLLGRSAQNVSSAASNALRVARVMHSTSPDHGAEIVSRIWGNNELRVSWLRELADMCARLRRLRSQLADVFAAHDLHELGQSIRLQRGMFALLPLDPGGVDELRTRFHIYVEQSGRVNLAGLPESRIQEVGPALATVIRSSLQRPD